MSRSFRFTLMIKAGLLLLALPAVAQLHLGETSTTASGTISSGYTATYGNMTGATHGWTYGGAATFSGSFHSPNFLSYSVAPYLNQSRSNSNFQSISNASGVDMSATIFGGSQFPGSINYARAYNSEGNYNIPGVANYVTHGNSDTFGINWNEILPDKPSFSAGFQTGSSQYTVYGSNDDGNNTFHTLNLHSGYKWEGFNMGAYYTKGTTHSLIPQVVAGSITQVHSDNDAYGFNVSHWLPLHGSVSSGVNRSDWKTDYAESTTNGSIDTVNTTAGVHPTQKLSFTVSMNYSDNLAGQIVQSVVAAGGGVPALNSNQSSNSLDLMTVVGYTPLPNLQTSAYFERRTQTFYGTNYGVKSYGGSVTYAHALLNGTLNSSVSVTANSSEQNGQDTIGFSATENYSNTLLGWHVNESFSYAQNVETLLVTYTNSFYNYSGNVRRHWGRFSVSMGGGGARTALSQQAGTSNSSQNYSASLGFGKWVNANGSYAKSDGQGLITGTGLVGIPVPSPVLPSSLVSLYGGKSYSFGLSSTPKKGLILAATYAKSTSNTLSNGISSLNDNYQYNALVQYQVRKLSYVSGYSRLQQSFSASGTQPEIISSYYMGLTRWFNLF